MGTLPKHYEFLLDLDGFGPCCRCYSVEVSPSLARSVVVDDPIGPHNGWIRHSGPVTLHFNSGIGREIVHWIADTMERRPPDKH